MFSKLRLLSKQHGVIPFWAPIFRAGVNHYSMDKLEIVDIDMDSMMYDDNYNEEKGSNIASRDPPLKTMDIDGAPIAPIDINPWIEEEELKEGTVLEDTIERKEIISVVPEPPKDRSGIYEFKGIKIVLPKKLLSSATYRYRLDQEDLEHLADDIRICKYDK